MNINDTIAAIATPVGEGGIGVIRISGSNALAVAVKNFKPAGKDVKAIKSHRLYLGTLLSGEGTIDEVCLVYMKAPRSYTRQDCVELSCHGSPAVLRHALRVIMENGARMAEPGEFTKRAFLNGRINLSQAEGVIDLIKARSEGAATAALHLMEGGLSSRIEAAKQKLLHILSHLEASIDFPDEELETATDAQLIKLLDESIHKVDSLVRSYESGKFLKNSMKIAIIGKTNVGKSSLLNALLEEERAIVTEHPGTTRDLIRGEIEIAGIPVEFVDTAGLNKTADEVESIGIERTLKMAQEADLVIALFDGSRKWDEEDSKVLETIGELKNLIILINKSDIEQKLAWPDSSRKTHPISVNMRTGFEHIEEAVKKTAGTFKPGVEPLITRARHLGIFKRISEDLHRARQELSIGREIAAAEIWDAVEEIKRFTGESYTEEVLSKIFDEFCIGK